MGLIKLASDNEIDSYHKFNKNVGTGLGAILGAAIGTGASDELINNRGRISRAKSLLNRNRSRYSLVRPNNFSSITNSSKTKLENIIKKYENINNLKRSGAALTGAVVAGLGIRALVNREQKHEKELINSGKATLTLAR